MSIDDRLAEAEQAANRIQRANTGADSVAFASEATAHALIAIAERLGELVEQQRTANTIAAFQSGVVRNDTDYGAARETVRRLLDLAPEAGERP